MPNKDCPWGYTRGLHQQVPVCRKALFYGAFSKPFYYGGEGGILTLSQLHMRALIESRYVDFLSRATR
jgi:hypothetical protein